MARKAALMETAVESAKPLKMHQVDRAMANILYWSGMRHDAPS